MLHSYFWFPPRQNRHNRRNPDIAFVQFSRSVGSVGLVIAMPALLNFVFQRCMP